MQASAKRRRAQPPLTTHYSLLTLRILLHLDAGEVDDLFPFGGLVSDDLAELFRRRDDRNGAELGETLLDRGLGEDLVHFLVELLDDLVRRALRRAHSEPGARLVILDGLADRRDVGQL